MKRNIILLLIAASVLVTLYIKYTAKPLDPALKAKVESAVMSLEQFPARPVWWHDDSVLAVGVVKKQHSHNSDAEEACKLALKQGVMKLKVEVYDLADLQQKDDWTLIGSASCTQESN